MRYLFVLARSLHIIIWSQCWRSTDTRAQMKTQIFYTLLHLVQLSKVNAWNYMPRFKIKMMERWQLNKSPNLHVPIDDVRMCVVWKPFPSFFTFGCENIFPITNYVAFASRSITKPRFLCGCLSVSWIFKSNHETLLTEYWNHPQPLFLSLVRPTELDIFLAQIFLAWLIW